MIAQTRHGIADCVTGSRFQNGDQRSPLWFSEGWADQFGVPEDRIWSENGSKGRITEQSSYVWRLKKRRLRGGTAENPSH